LGEEDYLRHTENKLGGHQRSTSSYLAGRNKHRGLVIRWARGTGIVPHTTIGNGDLIESRGKKGEGENGGGVFYESEMKLTGRIALLGNIPNWTSQREGLKSNWDDGEKGGAVFEKKKRVPFRGGRRQLRSSKAYREAPEGASLHPLKREGNQTRNRNAVNSERREYLSEKPNAWQIP